MRRLLLAAAVSLGGCTGLNSAANHPVECAIGFAWPDCEPGTAGYARGHPEPQYVVQPAPSYYAPAPQPPQRCLTTQGKTYCF